MNKILAAVLMLTILAQPAFAAEPIVVKADQGIGLGQLIRNLGYQPDWRYRDWQREIVAANPGKFNEQAKIIKSGSEIVIPQSALAKLNRTEMPALGPEPAPSPSPTPSPPPTPMPTPPPTPMPTPAPTPMPEVKKASKLTIQASVGIAEHKATNTVTAETAELKSNVGFGASLHYLHRLGNTWSLTAFAGAEDYRYKQAPGISLQQKQTTAGYGGLGIEYAVGSSVDVGVYGAYRQVNYVKFSGTDLSLELLGVTSGGAQITTWIVQKPSWRGGIYLLGEFSGEQKNVKSLDLKASTYLQGGIRVLLGEAYLLDLAYHQRQHNTTVSEHATTGATANVSFVKRF